MAGCLVVGRWRSEQNGSNLVNIHGEQKMGALCAGGKREKGSMFKWGLGVRLVLGLRSGVSMWV